MALGQQCKRQKDPMVGCAKLQRFPLQAFYNRLETIVIKTGSEGFADVQCALNYGGQRSRPLLAGRSFRMYSISYLERIDSGRLEWRCADRLSLWKFRRLDATELVPGQSWLSITQSRLPLEAMFVWVLRRSGEHGLIKGDSIGVTSSMVEENAALRLIVRRGTGEDYREMLKRSATESGIGASTTEDLIRLNRNRQRKWLSKKDWTSGIDIEAKVVRLNDGRAHLAYKPKHLLNLDTGDVVAAGSHPADQGDITILLNTLAASTTILAVVDAAPGPEYSADSVCGFRYGGLKALDSGWKSRLAKTGGPGIPRSHCDGDARRALYNIRARLRASLARDALKPRNELVEHRFALTLDRSGTRWALLRGRENLLEPCPNQVPGYSLGLITRLLVEAGTSREALAGTPAAPRDRRRRRNRPNDHRYRGLICNNGRQLRANCRPSNETSSTG